MFVLFIGCATRGAEGSVRGRQGAAGEAAEDRECRGRGGSRADARRGHLQEPRLPQAPETPGFGQHRQNGEFQQRFEAYIISAYRLSSGLVP